MPAGRPSDYTGEIAERICVRLAMGESLKRICADDDMPAQSTVYTWLLRYPEFVEKYARARELQAETCVDEMHEIADDGSNDWMERRNENGDVVGWTINGEHVQRSKLRIDTRKWTSSKLAPKKYGDRSALEIAGDPDAPIQMVTKIEYTIIDPADKGSEGV